jgi:hypothetical protein
LELQVVVIPRNGGDADQDHPSRRRGVGLAPVLRVLSDHDVVRLDVLDNPIIGKR